jgi:hypothetical protein
MSPNPARPVACRTCGSLLNRYIDLDTYEERFTHPISAMLEVADHEPDPVPADQIDARHVCDFCSDEKVVYTFRTRPVETVVLTAGERLVQHYGTDWSACIDCATSVQARDLDGLHARVMRLGLPLDQPAIGGVRIMQQTVLDSVLPGRELAAIGHWQPAPLPAPILPKIRDRLAQLVRGEDRLPLGLNDPDIRDQLAAGLDAARLYWIDAEFTDLAEHAARSLPTTAVTAADAPVPHGLLAWAQPVGDRADLTAASWASGPDGIRIVCYRSIGAGLQPASLQRLREQVGWLAPRHHAHLRPGDAVSSGAPVNLLVATWLLIAQKLAETMHATVDKTIRKAYRRTGRPAPEVRLVRIRGTAPGGNKPVHRPSPDDAALGPQRAYRWWVRGHWRNQPYGPGRAQRRLIYIDPQIRGPQDRPIKASTTVRVLGTRHTDREAPPAEPQDGC